MSFMEMINRAMRPTVQRVRTMITRGIVDAVDDSKKLQTLKVLGLAEEVLEGVEHFQPAGLTAVPLKDAECLLLGIGGTRSHAVALTVQDRTKRPIGMQPGEVALYRPDDGIPRVKLAENDDLLLGNSPTKPAAYGDVCDGNFDDIKAELDKIETTLGSLTGQASFGVSYTNGYVVSDPSAEEVKVK